MTITGIGINGDGGRLAGSLAILEEDLAYFAACGYDAVELSTTGLDVVANGKVRWQQVERVRAVCEKFPFTYTIHPPNRLNLAYGPNHQLERDNFLAVLEVCAALGARVMVYHSGLIALERVRAGLRGLPDEAEREEAAAQEVTALQELMPEAAARGVTVAMENRDPHAWELAVLRREGRPPEELTLYHGGLVVSNLIRQIKEVGHPDLGICLDLAHLFLATNHLGLDYLAAVAEAAPYVRHIHANDNFGQLDDAFDSLGDRNPYGDGDLHLPPGWGRIPLGAALARLRDVQSLLILEIRPRYREHLADALVTMRGIVAATD